MSSEEYGRAADGETSGRDSFLEAVAELRERIGTVHQRVACPTCKAGIGIRCVRVRTRRSGPLAPPPVTLKHPHSERLRAAGIPDR